MRLLNQGKRTILSKDLKFCSSLSDQLLGLLKRSNPKSLLFRTRFGIHTFFLKEPIDVIVLDKGFKVVKLGDSVKPNRFFFWNPKHNLVIELPGGVIRATKTTVGDLIQLRS